MKTEKTDVLIVGSGAAGLAAADHLYNEGIRDILILTEGLRCGTSINTGSDKQTYLRLSQTEGDSVREMARTLFDGGCVDGDLAYAEAAGSTRAFFHLVELGVAFPTGRYGEYVGYQTDHDEHKRGTSIGPLTSHDMCEKLIASIERKRIRVLEGFRALRLLTGNTGSEDNAAAETGPAGERAGQTDRAQDKQERAGRMRAIGVVALDRRACEKGQRDCLLTVRAKRIIWATGGEAGLYRDSVYPHAQIGGMGPVLYAGAAAKNLTESQFGIASTQFRWNLSGTYQQCLPEYYSEDADGNRYDFLTEGFPDPGLRLGAVFRKGYQWPFDPRRIENSGSSLIDILIYRETVIRGRKVYLDFRKDPACLLQDGSPDFSRLPEEAFHYLEYSGALCPVPLERLRIMNPGAIRLYRENGIDLAQQPLQIAVCAQHNNGGLAGDLWWETDIRGLYAVGEVNGSHGIRRPGGSALNAGQVGALRAALKIAHGTVREEPLPEICGEAADGIREIERLIGTVLDGTGPKIILKEELDQIRSRMSAYGGMIRGLEGVQRAIRENREQWDRVLRGSLRGTEGLDGYFILLSLLVSQYVYLRAMEDQIAQGGASRGSALVDDPAGEKELEMLGLRYTLREDGDRIREVRFCPQSREVSTWLRPVRPLPDPDPWFENVWREYREGRIYD